VVCVGGLFWAWLDIVLVVVGLHSCFVLCWFFCVVFWVNVVGFAWGCLLCSCVGGLLVVGGGVSLVGLVFRGGFLGFFFVVLFCFCVVVLFFVCDVVVFLLFFGGYGFCFCLLFGSWCCSHVCGVWVRGNLQIVSTLCVVWLQECSVWFSVFKWTVWFGCASMLVSGGFWCVWHWLWVSGFSFFQVHIMVFWGF